ncbi:MAG: DUF1266 domain-containing protein [Muribaculaceae bacterium]|nr:DUF1266 domain-containing protein [Muribaculaceae bacterium]
MEFFDYFTRLWGMDPTQLPVYARILTFFVPIVIVIYVVCLIVRSIRKTANAIHHLRQGIRTQGDASLTADQVRAIAVGALYAYQQGGYTDAMYPDIEKSRLNTMLSDWWGIDSRESAIATLKYLCSSPSQHILPFVVEAYRTSDKKHVSNMIKDYVSQYDDAKEAYQDIMDRVTTQSDNLKSQVKELIGDGIISSDEDVKRLGVIGWDAGRLNLVARASYQKGYISEEECLECVNHAYAMAKAAGFNSWKDFANSYMLGRTLWNGDCNMTGLAQDLLNKPESPWVRHRWEGK